VKEADVDILRDHFAGLALQSILSDPECDFSAVWESTSGEIIRYSRVGPPEPEQVGKWKKIRTPCEEMARHVYEIADAMISERGRKQ